MAIQTGLDSWVKAPEVILNALKVQDSTLDQLGITITKELVQDLLGMVEIDDTMKENFIRMIELQVLAWIKGMQSVEVDNILETKDDFLRELDFLCTAEPGDVSKNRAMRFKEIVFHDMNDTEIMRALHNMGSVGFNNYFGNHGWEKPMGEDLSDRIRRYIEANK